MKRSISPFGNSHSSAVWGHLSRNDIEAVSVRSTTPSSEARIGIYKEEIPDEGNSQLECVVRSATMTFDVIGVNTRKPAPPPIGREFGIEAFEVAHHEPIFIISGFA